MFFTDEFAENIFENYKQLFTIAVMIIYTLNAVRQIIGFRRLACGIAGTAALIAGEVLIYLIGPALAVAAVWVALGVFIFFIMYIFDEPTKTGK